MYLKHHNIYFSTISINKKVSVFVDYEDTIHFVLDSFRYLVNNKLVDIYSFVIMSDHVHLLWLIEYQHFIDDIVTKFKKFTGKRITDYLKANDPEYLNYFLSSRSDREYKIWKIKSKNIKITHPSIFIQKLNYIHENPTKGTYKTVDLPEEYIFSSASFYLKGDKYFDFLTKLG